MLSSELNRGGRASFWLSYGRVAWLSWRQSRLLLVIVTVLSLIGIAVPFALSQINFQGGGYNPNEYTSMLVFALVFSGVLMTGASASLFWPDHQQGNMRFFQQQRETPVAFWLGKLTPWMVATILISIAFTLAFNLAVRWEQSTAWYSDGYKFYFYLLLFPLTWMLVAWASGQLCSIFIPNPLISGITAMVLAATVASWFCYQVTVQESYAWFTLPMVVAFLVTSSWRCRDWLAGRNRWFHYAAPLTLCAAAVAASVASLIHHRATEIPDPPSDFVSLWYTALPPGALGPIGYRETAEMYRQAIEAIKEEDLPTKLRSMSIGVKSSDSTIAFEEKYAAVIDKIIVASKRPCCESIFDLESVFDDSRSESERDLLLEEEGHDQSKLRYALDCRIANSIAKVELDEALDALFAWDRFNQRLGSPESATNLFLARLIAWSDLPEQTPTQLRRAIKRLEREEPNLDNSTSEDLLRDSVVAHQFFHNNRVEGQLFRTQYEMLNPSEDYSQVFPWDSIRRKRLLKARANFELAMTVQMIPTRNDAPYQRFNRSVYSQSFNEQIDPFNPADTEGSFPYPLEEEHNLQRFTMLRLALVAYGLEHGEYPQRLDQLSDYFRYGVPLTIDQGKSFAWFPNGFGEPVYWHSGQLIDLDADSPVLLPCDHAEEHFRRSQIIELTETEQGTKAIVVKQESETTIRGTVFQTLDWKGKLGFLPKLPKSDQ